MEQPEKQHDEGNEADDGEDTDADEDADDPLAVQNRGAILPGIANCEEEVVDGRIGHGLLLDSVETVDGARESAKEVVRTFADGVGDLLDPGHLL